MISPPRRRLICTFVVLATTIAGGCARDLQPLPTYPVATIEETIATLRTRAASMHAATGQGHLILSNAARGSVELETVFVLAPPARARVRAWKFNQAVFDLTVKPEGVWLYSPRAGTNELAGSAGAGFRDWLGYLNSGIPETYTVATESAHQIDLNSPQPTGNVLTITIDRSTRTVQRYRLVDRSGVERFALSLDRYQDFSGTLWPARVEAHSPNGTIVVETRELQANVAAESAFTPPARAKRLP